MNLLPLFAVFHKELIDGLRDRRSLFSALAFPVLGPALVGIMLTSIAKSSGDMGPLELPVIGGEHAPLLIDYLERNGVRVVEPPEDPEAAVRDGRVDVILNVPEGFEERFRSARPAPVELWADSSRTAARRPHHRAERLLGAWSGQIGGLRLLARGVDPGTAQALQIETRELSTPATLAATLLEMVTMFVVVAAFFCNMYIAIDTTAGERERRSLEALLINPVPRWMVVLGKFFATALFGLGGVLLTMAFVGVALAFAPLEELGARARLTWGVGLGAFGLVLPVSLLAASVQLFVASFARSFKEAQTWLSLLLLLATVPGMAMTISPFRVEGWLFALPIVGQQVLVGDLLRGEAANVTGQWIATGSTLGFAALLLFGTTLLFQREAMTQGR